MVTIARDVHHQTVITTFEVMPGVCHDVLDLLRDAYDAYIRRQPGFLGAALHVNDAQTRIASYSQWRQREEHPWLASTAPTRRSSPATASLA